MSMSANCNTCKQLSHGSHDAAYHLSPPAVKLANDSRMAHDIALRWNAGGGGGGGGGDAVFNGATSAVASAASVAAASFTHAADAAA